jgi:hypothetical protein
MYSTVQVAPRRTPFVVALVAATIALLLLARTARAQTEITVGPILTVVPSAYETHAPRLTGLALGAYSGALGARVSGAMAIDANTRSSSRARVSTISDWIADGDVLLRIGGRDSYHGMSPDVALLGFIGAGAVAWRDAIDSMRVAPSWSHGGGLAVGLGESVELSGEARYRRPLQFDRNGEAAFSPRMEYRAGISLRFGGPSRRGPRRSTVIVGSGRAGSPAPRPSTSIPVSYPGNGGLAARVIPTAEEYLGTPYRYGGSSPATGFDCSGFVRYVYAKHGVKLPRTSREMASSGMRLKPDFSTLRAGDLVMFAEEGEPISHVAVYAGDDRIIHASSSAGRVRYDDLDTERGQWFRHRIVAARRVSPDARGLMSDLTASLLQESVKGLTFDTGDKAGGGR